MRSVVDSLSALIGDTPCIPLPPALKASHIYLKLEGFNPTGSIYDRFVLHSTLQGQHIAIAGNGAICASAALVGSILQVPVLFDPQDASLSVNMAEGLGAARAVDIVQNIQFDVAAALSGLIDEIKSEVPDVSVVLIPELPMLPIQTNEIKDIRIQWIPPMSSFPPECSELSQRGILIDAQSAYGVQLARAIQKEVVVIVCAIDGAIALEMEEYQCL